MLIRPHGWRPHRKGVGGKLARFYPLRPGQQAITCRRLAADLRAEHAAGELGPINIAGEDRPISRAEAARRLERQAERWEAECRDPITARNLIDRRLIGQD